MICGLSSLHHTQWRLIYFSLLIPYKSFPLDDFIFYCSRVTEWQCTSGLAGGGMEMRGETVERWAHKKTRSRWSEDQNVSNRKDYGCSRAISSIVYSSLTLSPLLCAAVFAFVAWLKTFSCFSLDEILNVFFFD